MIKVNNNLDVIGRIYFYITFPSLCLHSPSCFLPLKFATKLYLKIYLSCVLLVLPICPRFYHCDTVVLILTFVIILSPLSEVQTFSSALGIRVTACYKVNLLVHISSTEWTRINMQYTQCLVYVQLF
jgi:hypothetical protein